MRRRIRTRLLPGLLLMSAACSARSGTDTDVRPAFHTESAATTGAAPYVQETPSTITVAAYPVAGTLITGSPAHVGRFETDRWTRTRKAGNSTIGILGSVRMDMDEVHSVEVMVGTDLGSRSESYARDTELVHYTQLQSSVAVLVNTETRPIRYGFGGAIRHTLVEQSSGDCECLGRVQAPVISPGLVFDVAMQMPPLSRFFVDVRMQGRWFNKTSTDTLGDGPSYQTGGFFWMIALGLGWQVLR